MKKILGLLLFGSSLLFASTMHLNDSIFIKKIFNNATCDKVLSNQVVATCYSYKNKGANVVSYYIDGANVHEVNLEKRESWRENSSIPSEYRSSNKDYLRSGFDKGHLAMDSAFDYDQRILKDTYDLNLNAVPMFPNVNRKTWIKSESYAKSIAYQLGYTYVIDIVHYDKHPKTMGANKINIPSAFIKVISNHGKDFRKCFYYVNEEKPDLKNDKLKNHEIDCSKVL